MPVGPSTDRYNEPVIDPTENVKALSAADNRRQDDLRKAEKALRKMESKHIRQILKIRARHDRELRKAEAKRIDAIRETDAENARAATAAAEVRATALAGTVTAAAEANRSAVEAARQATADAQAAALAPVTSAIEQLRQAMYETQGQKTQVAESQARGASSGIWVAIAVSVFALLLTVIGIAIVIATTKP